MTYGKRVHNSLVSHAFTRPSNRDACDVSGSPRSRGLTREITPCAPGVRPPVAGTHSTRSSFAIILEIITCFCSLPSPSPPSPLYHSLSLSLSLVILADFFYLSHGSVTWRVMRPLIHELQPIRRRFINVDDGFPRRRCNLSTAR